MTKRKQQTSSSVRTSVGISVAAASRAADSLAAKSGVPASAKRIKTVRLPEDNLPTDLSLAQTATEDIGIDDIFKQAHAKKRTSAKPDKVSKIHLCECPCSS